MGMARYRAWRSKHIKSRMDSFVLLWTWGYMVCVIFSTTAMTYSSCHYYFVTFVVPRMAPPEGTKWQYSVKSRVTTQSSRVIYPKSTLE